MSKEIQKSEGFELMQRQAKAIAEGKLFGVTDVSQVVSLMLIAEAEGRSPATALRDYNVIQGKPALKSDAMLARFQEAGGRVEWKMYTDTKVIGKFSHDQGGSVEVDWDVERAEKAGLTQKNPNWKKYTRNMLRARVVSEGIRAVYPSVISGMYTPEEIQDVKPEAKTVEVNQLTTPTPQDIADFKADMIDADLWQYVPQESKEALESNPSFGLIDAISRAAEITKGAQ